MQSESFSMDKKKGHIAKRHALLTSQGDQLWQARLPGYTM